MRERHCAAATSIDSFPLRAASRTATAGLLALGIHHSVTLARIAAAEDQYFPKSVAGSRVLRLTARTCRALG
jgi:hypothetical protein